MTEALTFATGPVLLDEEGDELRAEVASHLASALEAPVSAVATRSYAELAALLGRGEPVVAWLPPALYVRSEATVGVRPLAALERSHGAGYRGVLFVPADAEARAVEDLRGKRVAWVDRDSCAGHLFVRLALRERGLEPAELFAEERFSGSHGTAVRAVMDGEADAGATHAQTRDDDDDALVLAGWGPYAGADGMRPLLVTRAIPPDVVCASRAVDPALAAASRDALLALGDARASLVDELFGAARLVAADPSAYRAVRAALE